LYPPARRIRTRFNEFLPEPLYDYQKMIETSDGANNARALRMRDLRSGLDFNQL
jgi:hypothetical protein